MSTPRKAPGWLRAVIDYSAPAAFLAFFLPTRDTMVATQALMAAAALAVVLGLVVERRIAWLPLIAGVFAMIFGGLTLFFHDDRFIKMKPTVVNLIFAGICLGGVLTGRNPIKAVAGESLHLPDTVCRTLAIRYGLFFIVLAAANEAVWRTQSTQTWAWFRFPGLLALTFLFALSQAPLMMRYAKAEDLPPPPPNA